jgi:four helix bundle protein
MRLIAVMPKLTSYRQLFVWQKSMDLAERCYRMTRRFKRDDQTVLGHEIRKSCVSIPSNIAEGFGRHYTPEYIHHLRFSSGSNNELQTQIELSKRVEIVGGEEAAILIADAEEIGRMLHGLIGSLDRVR